MKSICLRFFVTTSIIMVTILFSASPLAHSAGHENASQQAQFFAPTLEYFIDEGEQIPNNDSLPFIPIQWQKADSASLNFGFISKPLLLRFQLPAAQHPTTKLLEIANHRISQLSVYIYHDVGNSLVLEKRFDVGDFMPIADRPYPTRNFVFPIDLVPGQSKTIYLYSKNRYPMKLPIYVWEREHLERQNEARILFQGIYFGVILIMAIYNLCIYFFVKDKSYGTYSLFILCLAGYILIDRGLSIEYLWPNNPSYDFQMSLFFTALGSAISIPFTIQFLSLKENAPKIASAYRYLYGIWMIIAALSLIYPTIWLIFVVVIILIPGSVSLALVGILMWRKGVPAAPYYTLAWFVLILAVTIYDSYLMGFLPVSIFTEYSLQVGNMIEVTLLSLGLAYRIKSLDQEKREANLLTETKSEFLATMSHEIRTPMNGILGMAELLRDTNLSTQQITYLNTIRSSGKTLMTVLNDILDYSKIEAGKLELESVPYPVRRLVDETANIFSVTAKEKDIFFNVYVSPDTPAMITGDPTRVRQILTNLLSNAFKFTAKGHIIVFVYREPNSRFLTIKVEDTGVGIPEDKIHSVFEKFTQADKSTNRQYGGTGLGLPISKSFVEMMGGEIDARSEYRHGSTFWFTLPVIDPVPFSQIKNPEFIHQIKALRVLLINPDHRFTDQIMQYRETWQFHLTVSETLKQAELILKAATERYDFILVDQYCEDFSIDSANEGILSHESTSESYFIFAVKAGFPRDAFKTTNMPHTYEEYPLSISSLQLKIIDSMGLSRSSGKTNHSDALFDDMKVLVVDDNPVNTMVVTGYLRKLHIEAQSVNSGQAALDMICQSRGDFDLIFMDCEMPEIDGYTATSQIREWESLTGIDRQPICALSAHAMDSYQTKCFEVGMDDFLAKPIVYDSLKGIVSKYYKKRKSE
jgi:signal transduction histidine kinase/CheY-like chemotaxis protein